MTPCTTAADAVSGQKRPTHKLLAFTCLFCGRAQRRNVRVGYFVSCKGCGRRNPGPRTVAETFVGYAELEARVFGRPTTGRTSRRRSSRVSARELVAQLQAQGVRLAADGDTLVVRATRGILTAQDRAALAASKAEVLAELANPEELHL